MNRTMSNKTAKSGRTRSRHTAAKQTSAKQTPGRRIIAGLTELRDTLRTGVPLERRFTVKTVEVADPEDFSPSRIKALRLRLGTSQGVFAQLVGVSSVLVQSWEQGVRKPSPLARRLLGEMQHDPRRWQRMIGRAA